MSLAASILEKYGKKKEDQMQEPEKEQGMSIAEMVTYIKEKNWSSDKEMMKEAMKCMEKMCEQADSDDQAKDMLEYMDKACEKYEYKKK